MTTSAESLSRVDVLNLLSRSATYGNLGAFIGAGFSKAVLNGEDENLALSWGELLDAVASNLKIKGKVLSQSGMGYPEIATALCDKYSQQSGISYSDALKKIKFEIAKLTGWYPDKKQRATFSEHMTTLDLSWIITTNYDLIIESLLTGASLTLGPDDSLTAPAGIVPVFHLHGVRTNPEGIIIAQEDYVSLFRPTEYRQIKLALMIKESTMLILGYGLGDVNVLTALDWSKNVFRNTPENYPNEVIQVVRKNDPKADPYRDRNNIIIIETADLTDFFSEYAEVREASLKKYKSQKESLATVANKLNNPDESTIEKFIDNESFRKEILHVLGTFPHDLISGFVSFLDNCIDETWVRAGPKNAFQAYADNLTIIMDILTSFTHKQIPPALFETTAYAFHRVSGYVGSNPGQSFAAGKVWCKRKEDLSKEMIMDLRSFAQQHNYHSVLLLCEDL